MRSCRPWPSSASAKSFAEPKRSAGSFWSAVSTACSTAAAHTGRFGRNGAGLLREHLGDDGLGVRAHEGRLAGEHLVRHGAERIDITAGADLALAHRLFGRHVRGRAERHAGLRHPAAARLLHRQRDAEVGDEGRAFLEQDVLGLDVAMDDAVAVGVVERTRHFLREADGVVDGELLLAAEAAARSDSPATIRHDIVEEPVGLARVDQAEYVRVLQVGGDPDLGEEAVAADDGAQLGMEDLDGDLAAVLQVLGEVDGGHAALAELALEAVTVTERIGEAVEAIQADLHMLCAMRAAPGGLLRGTRWIWARRAAPGGLLRGTRWIWARRAAPGGLLRGTRWRRLTSGSGPANGAAERPRSSACARSWVMA